MNKKRGISASFHDLRNIERQPFLLANDGDNFELGTKPTPQSKQEHHQQDETRTITTAISSTSQSTKARQPLGCEPEIVMAINNVNANEEQKRREADEFRKNLTLAMQVGGTSDALQAPPIPGGLGSNTSRLVSVGRPSSRGLLSIADNERTRRATKTPVQVRVVFVKIGEIDTVKEQYSADILIQSRWREPLLDNKSPEELKTANLANLWSPCLYIDNALAETKDSSFRTVAFNSKGEAFIAEQRKLRGIFLENLELQNFPLDVQDLSITIVSERPVSDVELVQDEKEPSSVNIGTFADAQEWRLYQHVENTKKMVTIEVAEHQRQHSAMQVTCRAARRPGFFLYNVFFVMFLISSMVFATFAVDCNIPQNRLQLTFTLLLTSIAFKMAINQSLPKISYLTYMDTYIIMSIVFLVLVCIWHAVVPMLCASKVEGSFYATKTELYILFGFLGVYLIGHIAFAIFIYIHAWKKRLEMARKDREFLRLRADLHGVTSKLTSKQRGHRINST